MSICHCGKILPEISSNYRYCSRCGTAHLARCLAPDCKAMVPYQQTPFCASCGTFYRYNEHGAPISCSADKSAESVLYDLLPASGDVLAANALYAKRNAEYPTPSDIGETLYPLAGMPLLREAQLRHNRLYCLTMSGSIEVIDMSTLQTLPQMHTTLPQLASTMIGSYVPTSLEVGTYAFVVRHKNQICGFHTGSGAPLFEFSVEDFQELTTCLNQEHLLVVGSTHQTQEARLYAISDLCRNNTHPRTIKPLTNVSYENLPPRRILPSR